MKTGFAVNNSTMIGVDWSFVPEVSGETAVEEGQGPPEGADERKVTGGVHVAENVVVLDEPEAEDDPAGAEAVLPDQQ
ncbi:hypothetical protein TIFTF001_008949 [Ficus carica]|uniref:Uncharacterized protein n=1 Tax=Ficus carica TaxID=3494 RepID=A0AA88D0Y8_FICCA|nr:hypothetical protein TIFTF001_008949 [Ficus carica]